MINTCVRCGKEFESTHKTAVCPDCGTTAVCVVCGKEFELKWPYNAKTCSSTCRGILRKESGQGKELAKKSLETKKERYGNTSVNVSLKPKKCAYCGKMFIPNSNRQKYCGDDYGNCPVCGKLIKIKDMNIGPQACSMECRQVLIEQTNLEKYGVKNTFQSEEAKEKSKETCLEKYGKERYQSTTEYREKYINTMNDKYGVDAPLQNKDIKEKWTNTNLEKYNTKYPSQNKDIQNKISEKFEKEHGGRGFGSEEINSKIKETMVENYGVQYPLQSDTIKAKTKTTNNKKYGVDNPLKSESIKNRVSKTCLEKYGVEWACMRNEARQYYTISNINKTFAELLDKNNIDYEMEFPLGKYSYDFKINNILLEINPTITHNSYFSVFDKNSNGLDKNYHYNKTKTAIDNSYKCVNIFDWDDYDKIINILKPKKSIYARNCTLQKVTIKECSEFLNKYHLQNTCKGQEIRLGLYFNKKLVQIMTFGKPRYNKKYQWELLRLCSDSKYAIVGGAERLFKHFISTVNPESIISYCDISKFSGYVYTRLKMTLINTTSPNKIWSKDTEKITNNFLLQRGYDQLFKTSYGKGTSNEELMLENGWLPVYDCGQSVYEYKIIK